MVPTSSMVNFPLPILLVTRPKHVYLDGVTQVNYTIKMFNIYTKKDNEGFIVVITVH